MLIAHPRGGACSIAGEPGPFAPGAGVRIDLEKSGLIDVEV